LVLFYEILVYSLTWREHLSHLEFVLQLLKQYQIFVSKCSFGLQQVEYFGHTISSQGVAMGKLKAQTLLDWFFEALERIFGIDWIL